jgi:hypothetical protein
LKKQITSFKELYIPKPCHQDWDTMTAVEKGRFCGSCKKVVYDFTEKTEEDFNLLYQQNKGNICVRFDSDQIDQDYAYIANVQNNAKLVRLKRFFSFLITFLLLKLSSIRSGFAQQSQVAIGASFGNTTRIVFPDPNDRKIEKTNVQIKGKVLIEDTENGLSEADINLYDNNGTLIATTVSGTGGVFLIALPDDLNLNQTFSITVNKEKVIKRSWVFKYSKDHKEITEKDFESVLLEVDVKKRTRRDLLGRRKGKLMGCPKFR